MNPIGPAWRGDRANIGPAWPGDRSEIGPAWDPGGAGLVFSILNGLNGVDFLNPALTINGITKAPDLRYKLGDADGTNLDPWTYGSILPLQAGTAPSYNQGSPLLGINDDSALLNAGGYYQSSGNTLGDVALEDIVTEFIFKMPPSGTKVVFGKRLGAAGYGVFTGSGFISLRIEDSSANSASIASTGMVPNAWYHVIAFWNRSDATHGARAYVNGVLNGSVADITSVGSITVAQPYTVGAWSGGASPYDSNIAYLALWKQTNWHQAGAAGPTEWAAIAKERFLKLTGFWSDTGTVTYARATEGVMDKLESGMSKLYTVGAGWPRLVHREDGTSDEIKGYLVESEDENELLYSEDFSQVAAWTPTRSAISSNGALAPNDETTADGLVADSVPSNQSHYVGQAIASSAAEHIFGVFLKPGDKTWAYLNIPTVTNANSYFNLSTGAIGTVGAAATAWSLGPFKNGHYRYGLIYTGGAPSHSHDIYAAVSDGTLNFTGDDSTVDIWMWGAAHTDEGLGFPTSYIKTLGSLVTRVKDDLTISSLTLPTSGRITASVLIPNYNNATTRRIAEISDGSANNYVYARLSSTDVFTALIGSGGASQTTDTGTTDISDGIKHSLQYKYSAGQSSLIVDGVTEDTGTPATMPATLSEIDVGQTWFSTVQLNGVIATFRIKKG